jgi:hypothetical protein
MATIQGYVVIQQHKLGNYTDAQIKKTSESLTPSAKALQKALIKAGRLANPDEGKDSTDSSSNKGSKSKSTITRRFEMDMGDAVKLLNHIDKDGNTPEFDNKLEKYLKVKRLYPGSISQLPLNERKEAMLALQKVGFTWYSYQVYIRVSESGKPDADFIKSKKHSYLIKLSFEHLENHQFSDFNVKWATETEAQDQDPDDNPSEGTVEEQESQDDLSAISEFLNEDSEAEFLESLENQETGGSDPSDKVST